MKNSHGALLSGFIPVVLALFGNALITVIKFIGFSLSGSGAMFSEAIHSVADTLNQGLLLIGLKSSTRKADGIFSYGYGKERFFWALMSACGIFFLGAGVTIYHGIELLFTHDVPHITRSVFLILGASFLLESITFYMALRELRKEHRGKSLAHILLYGDPTTIAVLYEDGVAVLGVLVALVSILLTKYTGLVYFDAIGSIAIGVLLGVVAVILIRKNRGYLIGMTIPEETKARIIEILEADPAIDHVIDFKSTILNVGIYHIKCEVEFNGAALMKDVVEHGDLDQAYARVRDDYPEFIRFLSAFTGRIPRLMGSYIDGLEKRVTDAIPELRHIDIEIN
jgi:zinc transporter 9